MSTRLVACGALLWRSPHQADTAAATDAADTPPTWRNAASWVALAAVPSGLLVAVTAHISTDVAAVPLLWVLPLALYLLTFVIVFARRPMIPHWLVVAVQPVFVIGLVAVLIFDPLKTILGLLAAHLVVFFVNALMCHGELARMRPAPRYLTGFYLWMATGGVVGGIAAGLIAPYVFDWVAEYPILLALALLPQTLLPAGAEEEPKAATPADEFALKASLQTHLAYVITGDPEIDRTSEEGLSGLSKILRARTALEPADPMGVDIEKDELAFFPILYWPVREDAKPLSDTTLAKIDAFMKQGGLIIFDTRDHDTELTGASTQNKALTRLVGQLDIPPLEPVPENHVLTKSFYLMRSFPGRFDGGSLWVEAEPQDEAERTERSRRTDGVSSIVITSNDFAGAWALDESNRPIYPTVPGGEVQREMAFRAGVNIVMYALTGNYKADQVHVPALLERLGQ